MGRVTITGCGGARHHPEDDTWTFPTGSPEAVTIDAGEVVGFRYRVAGRGRAVRVDLSIVFHAPGEPAPAPEFGPADIEPREEFFRHAAPPDGFLVEGRPLRATFTARAGRRDEPATASLLIVPAGLGRAFSGQGLPTATDHGLGTFERRFGTTLRPDYRAFLKRVNGVDLVWWREPAWPRESDAFIDALIALEPTVRRDIGADWEGPHLIYGIGNEHPYLDLAAMSDDVGFYRSELMRHAYVVGVDGGGNNFVQVVRGRRAGRIYGVDHETYYGGLSSFVDFEHLDAAARADLPWTDFAEADTDAVIGKAEEYGFLYPIADDFTTWYEREIAVARALSEALAPGYRRG